MLGLSLALSVYARVLGDKTPKCCGALGADGREPLGRRVWADCRVDVGAVLGLGGGIVAD
jgi:hypothetical protein